MQNQNLFLTTDKFSAVSFGFDKNTWSLYEDGKTFVLSVGPKYSYDFLYNAMEGIDDDRVELIVKAVIGDRMELLSADEYCFIWITQMNIWKEQGELQTVLCQTEISCPRRTTTLIFLS